MKRKLIAILMVMTLVLSCGMVTLADELSEEGMEIPPIGNDESEEEKENIVPEVSADTLENVDIGSEIISEDFKESDTETQTQTRDGENTAEEEVPIDEAHFPDVAFREMIRGYDGDGNGCLSQEERDSVEEIELPSEVENATGIEYFTNLKVLRCYYAERLKSLDVGKNINLENLSCSGTSLTSLDLSNNLKLRSLGCSNNKLSNLDISKNLKLERLYCGRNQLTSLDVSNNKNLELLECRRNQLTDIDVSNNKNLKIFTCRNNQLQNLDIANNPNLEALDCAYNQLSHLDVSKNPELRCLWCEDNRLEELNVNENAELAVFKCYDNQLFELDLSSNRNMPIRNDEGNNQNDLLARDLEGAFVTPQSVSKTVTKVNGKWSFDLAAIIGKDNIGRVSLITEGAELFDSGVVTFSGDKAPAVLEYTYDTKNPAEATPMTVQVALGIMNDQTKEEVSIDTSGLDLDRICREHNIDPSKAEIVLSQEAPDQKDTEKLTQKAKENGYSFVNAYEVFISLYSDGNKVADITENFGKLILTLQAGKDYAGYNAAVYQLHNGEEIISHESLTVDAEGMVTITVDKFSTFAVAVKDNSSVVNPEQKPDDAQTSTNNPNNSTTTVSTSGNNTTNARSVKTGDSSDVVLWSLLCLVSMGAGVLLVRKKYYRHS